jgi:hypothetical protein
MNRIYQGRVTKVEDVDIIESTGTSPSTWAQWLWAHHVLFQDAVNYYIVCLLALATDAESETAKIRERIIDESGDGFVWGRFRRRGVWRRGLLDSVAPYVTPKLKEPTFEQVAEAIFEGNPSAKSEKGQRWLAAGHQQVIDYCAKSNVQKAAPEFLPRFCKPEFKGNFVADTTTLAREVDKLRWPFVVHDPNTTPKSRELSAFSVHSIALPNARKPEFKGEEAREKLGEMVAEWRERKPGAKEDWERIETKVTKLPKDLVIPGYAPTSAKGEVKCRLFAFFLFRYVEASEFTLGLLRETTAAPKPGAKPPANEAAVSSEGDPIRLARGKRGYVFRAFTSLPVWGGDESGTPQWIEFDVAAFEEALKAMHQVSDKGEERRKEFERKKARWEYQWQATFDPDKPTKHDTAGSNRHKWKQGGAAEDEHRPPVLFGDPRIERLIALVDHELRAEYEMSEGVEVKYGLHPRTIRGFRDLQKTWNKNIEPDEKFSDATYDKLLAALREFQKENPRIIGSVRLFEELLKEQNWLIWRTPTAAAQQQWRKTAKLSDDVEFASDPLQALTDERELLEEMDRLKEPIRLTPADPEHSRRQFYFSDVAKLTPRGEYRHEPNQRTVIVPLAQQDERGVWRQTRVRLQYSAPRLLREGLRAESGENLGAMPWLQPMMAALGLKEPMPQDFSTCPVALMPEVMTSGEKRFLLNFPITLEPEPLAKQLGKQQRWDDSQFGGADGESYWLRWPSTPAAKAKTPRWWENGAPFSVLSVDLGQRDAGAFAVLEVTAGKKPKEQSRKLGEAGEKTWWATLRGMGMLRLPGEDAMVLRDGKWQQELSGERGRLPLDGKDGTRDEWNEAEDICRALDLDPQRILGDDRKRYSFPELNDQLLYALRRAQTRLARLQSWSCIASDEKRRKAIAEQILDAATPPKDSEDSGSRIEMIARELQSLVKKESWNTVAARLIEEVERERERIPKALVQIADRILPLRGRRWEWVLRDDGSKCHVLRQTDHGSDPRPKLLAGQRGLSVERIEQLDNLRQRCQSLNRALMQTPGQPAKLGRSKRGIELPDPCPDILDKLENLKDQRVDQTAHLILAQALGVRLRAHQLDDEARRKRDVHGEYEKFREPVDFLVLENLDRYLASQGRARNENSRLMKWCHRQILLKLKQLCEPYGLRVLETPAAYSSRFCSRTSVAGFRAVELTPTAAKEKRWTKHLDRLQEEADGKRTLKPDERVESQYVKALLESLHALNAETRARNPDRPKWRTLLAPMSGGPIFVPMYGTPMQADMNAAINLGLRAIAAPDNHEIHVRVRSERKGDKFYVRAENVREKARWGAKPPEIRFRDDKDRVALLTETRPNFFIDVGRVAKFDKASLDGQPTAASGRGLWGTIRQNEWKRIAELNAERARKAGGETKEEDNVQF